MSRSRLTIVVVVLSVVTTIALAAGGRTDHARDPTPTGGPQITLPLDAFQLTPAETALVDRARRSALAACLRRFGIDTPAAVEPRRPATLNERRYGVSDPRVAAGHGYHPAYGERDPGGRAPRDADERAALTGEGPRTVDGKAVPPGGCVGVVDRELTRGAPDVADVHLVYRLGAESFQRSRTDPRLLAAFARWSTCMGRAGYAYADPTVAMADPRFQTPAATPAEIGVATADVDCKTETGIVALWTELESALQYPLIAVHRPALDAMAALNRARVANASHGRSWRLSGAVGP